MPEKNLKKSTQKALSSMTKRVIRGEKWISLSDALKLIDLESRRKS